MQIPGFIYTAVLVGLYAFFQAISGGLETLADAWWQPVAVAAVAAEAYRDVEEPRARVIGEQPRGFWSRFLLG